MNTYLCVWFKLHMLVLYYEELLHYLNKFKKETSYFDRGEALLCAVFDRSSAALCEVSCSMLCLRLYQNL